MRAVSSSQVVAAIAAAAERVGLNAADINTAAGGPLVFRVRYFALAGLLEALPAADAKGVAKLLSLKRNAPDELKRTIAKTSWWREDWAPEIAEAVRLAPPDPEAAPGVVGGLDGGHLKAFIERIERVHEERAALGDDLKEIYAEAKGNGYDVKIMRKLIALRRLDPAQRMEEEEILDLYVAALGE